MPETLVVPKFKSTITFGRTPTEAIVFGRLSYVKTKGGKHNLFDQRDRTDASGNIIGQDGGWGASLLITPGTDYTAWTAAALAVMESVHGSDRSKWPSKFTYRRPRGEEKDNIIRPIDLAKNPGYDGWEVMPFATYGEPPTIVGPNLERVMNRDEVYSGRWAYVAVNLYWMKGGPNTPSARVRRRRKPTSSVRRSSRPAARRCPRPAPCGATKARCRLALPTATRSTDTLRPCATSARARCYGAPCPILTETFVASPAAVRLAFARSSW
jgi:hypothetical protein